MSAKTLFFYTVIICIAIITIKIFIIDDAHFIQTVGLIENKSMEIEKIFDNLK